MPKHEPLTAKAIGKRIKSKGLQKLKFFCQMCQKQCRDENGFKCHMTSESHQRQLLLFAENPNKYMDAFSSEFLKDFLHLLKRRYSTKRVFANQVYQEYIKDRNHLHMNATRWVTLSGFVKWMGICHVDNTEKGWFITYIDRDPETLLKQENLAKKEKMAKDDEERQAKVIADQIKRGLKLEVDKCPVNENVSKEMSEANSKLFKKQSDDQKIAFTLSSKPNENKPTLFHKPLTGVKAKFESDEKAKTRQDPYLNLKIKSEISSGFSKSDPLNLSLKHSNKKKLSALDEIIEEQERWKSKRAKSNLGSSRSLSWILPCIVVRVKVRELGKQYYNKKAVVRSVDGFAAKVEIIDSGDLLEVDEQHLETVVPKRESRVMILRGLYREREAVIVDIDERNEKVAVNVIGVSNGLNVQLSFDHVSKMAE